MEKSKSDVEKYFQKLNREFTEINDEIKINDDPKLQIDDT